MDELQLISEHLKQFKNIEITDMRVDKEGFGEYIFGKDDNLEYFIKILPISDNDPAISKKKLQQAQQEANQLKQCQHANILKYYDDFQLQNNYFILLEKCQLSLQEWIDKNRRNPIEREVFIKLSIEILQAALYIHQNNYLLNNISLKNIFLDRNLNIKFSTFSTLKEINSLELQKLFITAIEKNELFYFQPKFLKIEGSQKIQLQVKEDLWPIGICLYALTGVSYIHILNIIQEKEESFEIKDYLGYDINQVLIFILHQSFGSLSPSIPYLLQYFLNLIILPEEYYSLNNEQKQLKIKCKKTKDIDTKSFISLFLVGVSNFAYRDEISQEAIEKVIEIDPDNDICNFLLGDILESTNQYEKSVLFYQKAIVQNPKNDLAYYGLGYTKSEQKEFDISLECYNKCIEINPWDDQAYNNKGQALMELLRFKEALVEFKKSLEINPKQDVALYNIGIIYKNSQQVNHSNLYFKKSIKIFEDDSCYHHLALIQFQKFKYEKGIYYYTKADELSEENSFYDDICELKSLI